MAAQPDYLYNATLCLAVLTSLVASGAALLSLRNSFSSPAGPVPVATPPPTEEKKGESEESESEDDKDKDKEKEKEKEKEVIIDEAYKLIHQRYNRREYKW